MKIGGGGEIRLPNDLFILTAVDLKGAQLKDNDLKILLKCKGLNSLKVALPSFKGEELAYLRELEELEYLDLSRSGVKNDHLVHLKDHKRLYKLELS